MSSKKSTIKAPKTSKINVDYEMEYDIAVNNYLQAMMRKQLVDQALKTNKRVIEMQLQEQQDNLLKLKLAHKKLLNDIEDIQKQEQVVEALDILEKYVQDVKELFDKFDMESFLSDMLNRLRLECDKVVLKNVKPIVKQEELDLMMKKVQRCQLFIEKIMQSGAERTELTETASALKHNLELHQELANKGKLFNDLLEQATVLYLKLSSDYFAI